MIYQAHSCDAVAATTREAQFDIKMFAPTIKQEPVQCMDEEDTHHNDYMYPYKPLGSANCVNYYEDQFCVSEEVKIEFSEDEYSQSSTSVPRINECSINRRDDEATTSTSTGSRGPRGKNAQYYRDYRARKRAEQEKESLNRTSDPCTTADSSTINVAGSVTSKKRKSAAEYQREYRARKKAKSVNILIDWLAALPSTSMGGFTTTHQSTIVDQLTTGGPSTSSDIGFAKPTRRKTPAEYQREYRARKKKILLGVPPRGRSETS